MTKNFIMTKNLIMTENFIMTKIFIMTKNFILAENFIVTENFIMTENFIITKNSGIALERMFSSNSLNSISEEAHKPKLEGKEFKPKFFLRAILVANFRLSL